jgi:hypothetical protein
MGKILLFFAVLLCAITCLLIGLASTISLDYQRGSYFLLLFICLGSVAERLASSDREI